jgi:mannose-6-phosphate isomerase-like protein (cupin superfamily)
MFHGDILKLAKANMNFRKVLYTGKTSQLVLMNIKPKEDIGMETHDDVDQILFFESGTGKAVVGGKTAELKAGDVVFVPAKTAHNFINTGKSDMKLYTVYSPPEHADGTIHKTKKDAEKEEH